MLLQVGHVPGQGGSAQLLGEVEGGPPGPSREEVLRKAGEEYRLELQPLGLVESHHLEGVGARLRLPHQWRPAQGPQLLHVAHEPGHPIVSGYFLEPTHHVFEEVGDVLQGPAGPEVIRVGQGLQVPGPLHEEGVEDPTGGVAPGQGLAVGEVGQGLPARRLALLGELSRLQGRRQHLPQGPLPSLGPGGQGRQVLPRQPVDGRAQKMVQGLIVPRIGHRLQKRQHKLDLLLVEQPRPEPAGQHPRHPGLGQGPEVGVGPVTVAVEHRHLPVGHPLPGQLPHLLGQELRLLHHGGEVVVAGGGARAHRCPELFLDPVGDLSPLGQGLQPVGVVPDEPQGGGDDLPA